MFERLEKRDREKRGVFRTWRVWSRGGVCLREVKIGMPEVRAPKRVTGSGGRSARAEKEKG